ncbi:class II aldolase/adducin family protein [Pontibacter sp. G13]|uniref:class II aldolase/adducin family protein n=1 Tax=Pontibacter sp. G13 TaxID=3074898 RepID=UPI00288B73E5|nr:class II aldolase/adducin family protein [Pontibacter sp. G13]WNJ19682.1 class II aldolase/adducin family protein [Pontibacter sp. G13]
MIDEGYIKYRIQWLECPALPADRIEDLISWRDRLHQLGLIGYDEEQQVGYGNISERVWFGGELFIISGTQTGEISETQPAHYSSILSYSIPGNCLTCRGPVKASSESLTHAAVYEYSLDYRAVIHIHHRGMWEALKDEIPTTLETVPYGTPEMAWEIQRLLTTPDMQSARVCVMGGHQDGLLAVGKDLDEAGNALLALAGKFL